MLSVLFPLVLTVALANPQKCGASYYEVGNNIPTPSSSRYDRFHVLINTRANAIAQVDYLYAQSVPGVIGYVYTTGDGTLFASGLKRPSAAQRDALNRLYRRVSQPKVRAIADQAQYTTLVRIPPNFNFKALHYRLRPCVGG